MNTTQAISGIVLGGAVLSACSSPQTPITSRQPDQEPTIPPRTISTPLPPITGQLPLDKRTWEDIVSTTTDIPYGHHSRINCVGEMTHFSDTFFYTPTEMIDVPFTETIVPIGTYSNTKESGLTVVTVGKIPWMPSPDAFAKKTWEDFRDFFFDRLKTVGHETATQLIEEDINDPNNIWNLTVSFWEKPISITKATGLTQKLDQETLGISNIFAGTIPKFPKNTAYSLARATAAFDPNLIMIAEYDGSVFFDYVGPNENPSGRPIRQGTIAINVEGTVSHMNESFGKNDPVFAVTAVLANEYSSIFITMLKHKDYQAYIDLREKFVFESGFATQCMFDKVQRTPEVEDYLDEAFTTLLETEFIRAVLGVSEDFDREMAVENIDFLKQSLEDSTISRDALLDTVRKIRLLGRQVAFADYKEVQASKMHASLRRAELAELEEKRARKGITV